MKKTKKMNKLTFCNNQIIISSLNKITLINKMLFQKAKSHTKENQL